MLRGALPPVPVTLGLFGAEKGKGKDPGWVEGLRNTGYSG